MDLLGITMEIDLEITTDGRGLHIYPKGELVARRSRMKAAADSVMTKEAQEDFRKARQVSEPFFLTVDEVEEIYAESLRLEARWRGAWLRCRRDSRDCQECKCP